MMADFTGSLIIECLVKIKSRTVVLFAFSNNYISYFKFIVITCVKSKNNSVQVFKFIF